MLVKRKRLGKTQLTFVLDPAAAPAPVSVVGPFNDWDPAVTPLKKAKDGSLRATVTVEPGEAVAFRYVTTDGQWFDDDAADAYEPNEHGGVNGIARV